MRMAIPVLAAATVLALSGPALAGQSKAASVRQTGSAKAQAEKVLVASGSIAGYDAATNTLTVKTSKGEERFTLTSSTRIREGNRTLSSADLQGLTGREATVRYSESGGQRVVQSVRIGGSMRARHEQQH
ncbi:MAG TPA: hypothetical protein VNI83_05610 [Vicinamibacterales bacterium]|nr:hypothetical protein [Vicinamibacterales bacterium]